MKQSAAAARPAKKPASARDRRRMEELRRAREEAYETALKKLSPLLLSVLLVGVLVLAISFCDLAYIHNTDVGREVSVSLWSFALATVTGSFSSPAEVFGDIAVPFYYYAETGTILTGILSLLTILAALALIVLSAILFAKRKYDLLPLVLFAAGVTVILLIGCLIAALSLNGSQILPIYCSGNPACSIRSDGWFPLLSGVAALTLSVIAAIRYRAARRLLESPARPVRAGGAA